MNKISGTEVIIIITSEEIILILKINETIKVNLDNDKYYDLEVSLHSIENSKANLSIIEIREEIPIKKIFDQNLTDEIYLRENETIEDNKFGITGLVTNILNVNIKIVLWVISGILVLIFIITILVKFKLFSKIRKLNL